MVKESKVIMMKEISFDENTNEIFVTYFDEDPKKYAEKLENLFYLGIY